MSAVAKSRVVEADGYWARLIPRWVQKAFGPEPEPLWLALLDGARRELSIARQRVLFARTARLDVRVNAERLAFPPVESDCVVAALALAEQSDGPLASTPMRVGPYTLTPGCHLRIEPGKLCWLFYDVAPAFPLLSWRLEEARPLLKDEEARD